MVSAPATLVVGAGASDWVSVLGMPTVEAGASDWVSVLGILMVGAETPD